MVRSLADRTFQLGSGPGGDGERRGRAEEAAVVAGGGDGGARESRAAHLRPEIPRKCSFEVSKFNKNFFKMLIHAQGSSWQRLGKK